MGKWIRDDKLNVGVRMMIAIILMLVFVLASVFAVSFSSFISISMNRNCPEVFRFENFYLLTLAPVVLILFSLVPGVLVLFNFRAYWWKMSALLYVIILVLMYGFWFVYVLVKCS